MSRRRNPNQPDPMLTYAEAAKQAGLSGDAGWKFVRALAVAGDIPDVEVQPGVHRVHRDEVDAIRNAAVRAGIQQQ